MSQDESAVKDEVATQDTTVTDSAPVETKAPEVSDSFDEVWDIEKPADEPKAETEDQPSEEAPQEEQPSDEPVEETPAEEQPRGKAEERKQQLNAEIRDLVAQRNALKQEVEKTNAETYAPASVEDLVDQGMSELEAKVEAMRQSQEIDKFNNQVVEAQLTLESESSRVLRDFPMFDPSNEDSYQPEVAQKAAELLQQNLITDPNTGQVIGSHISPYKLYETIAAAHQVSSVQGQIKAQKATETMLANADVPGNAAPPKTKADPILELWKD